MPYFLNPAYLGALALVGVPLLIHLIRRRKLQIVKWAAMEFLQQSQRKQRRRLRIEELILLALRMLIVALTALAFARPVLRALGLPLLGQNARVYAVIVLDNSFSMGQKGPDGKTSWERAQSSTDQVLKSILKPGDSASLMLSAARPLTLIGAPSFDLALVARRAHAASLSDQDTDYGATAKEVEALLKASRAPYKEVYWLTDDQASAWSTSKRDAVRSIWGSVGKLARVTWVSVGAPPERRDNLAVHLLPPARELVTPHLQARIEAQVVNYGTTSHDNLLINLRLDGGSAASQRVTLGPGAQTVVAFTPLFPQAGSHTGSVEIADAAHADALPKDNVAPFVIRSRERLRVLVQDMRPSTDPAQSDSFYLLNALAPGGEAESIAPQLREGSSLSGVSLRDYDAVILAGASAPGAEDARALSEYVRAGGGLLIFPGNGTDAARLSADLARVALLPARLGGHKTLSDDAGLTLSPSTIGSHPALTMFKDTSVLNLGSARFTGYETLEPISGAAADAVQVMIRFSNGDPAFVERQVDLGRVILAASSAGTAWNQLPLTGAYLPLIYQLITYLSAGPNAHRNLRQDEPLFLNLPLSQANKPVQIVQPDGRKVEQKSVLDARGVSLRFADTHQAGIYRIEIGGKTVDAFAVRLPDDESDLATPPDIRQSLVEAGLPAGRLDLARSPAELAASVHRSRYGAETWRPLIGLVIALLFLESLLAQQFGRRG